MLVAHMDVVGVERGAWSVDPFGGDVRGEYVYGRGAIDDKGMLAANLEAMLLVKRSIVEAGGTLERDVVFVATSDEEMDGVWGVHWLLDHHPELADAELALNEGGRTRIIDGRPLYLAVQVAEKVSHVVTVAAEGHAGHASVPTSESAVFRLARALAAIERIEMPPMLTDVTRAFFASLAPVWPDATIGAAMSDVASSDPDRIVRGARALRAVPTLDALTRDTATPTILAAGQRFNVIPSEAVATLDVRTLPCSSVDDVVARLRSAVDDPAVRIEIATRGTPSPSSSAESPMFDALRAATAELDPELVVVPYMSTGATDNARIRESGIQAYGILPFPMDENDEGRMHGADERIALASLAFGTRLIYGTLVRLV